MDRVFQHGTPLYGKFKLLSEIASYDMTKAHSKVRLCFYVHFLKIGS